MAAVEALDGNGFPDMEIFQEYFSGLSDDALALELADSVSKCSVTAHVRNAASKFIFKSEAHRVLYKV